LSASAAGGFVAQSGTNVLVHLPFERQATVNGSFSILPIGTTDPIQPSGSSWCERQVTE
jgi:hypothetical protein